MHEAYQTAIDNKVTKHQNKGLDDYITDMNGALDILAKRLEETEYLAGDKYTLADCMAAVFIYWAFKNNDIVCGTHPISPKMIAWYENVSERDGFRETMNRSFTFGPDKLNEMIA